VQLLKRLLTSKSWILAVLVAIVIVALGFWLGWWSWLISAVSGWVWPALLLVIVVGGLVWVQWFLPRYRERRFLSRLHAAEAKTPGNGTLASDRAVQEKMLEAMRILRNAPEIRKAGGLPLYALPWFMLIGAPSSGKTTLLRGVANIFSPFARSATADDGPTPQCDWWFFNTAIILDTAGSYAFPASRGGDETQWYRFLQLLRHYRELQPINGMLIAVGADTLATKGPEELRVDAGELRKRVDETIRELGVEFPVYVLVTRCDLIEGFSEFFARLPEPALERVLGFVNEPAKPGQNTGFEPMYGALLERLLQLRLSLLREKIVDPTQGQKIFCFPEELRALQKPLAVFVDTLFAENPFQHTPNFRGLFLCSAQQQGTPRSFLRRDLRFDAQQAPPAGRSRNYFLHDLFSFILPRDRYLARSTARTTSVRRLRDLLTLGACLGLCALLGILLTRAFLSDRQIAASVDDSRCPAANSAANPDALLAALDACRQEVERLDEHERLRPAWATWLFDRSGALTTRLRQQYLSSFANGVLAPLDETIERQLTEQQNTIPLVLLLINRIELISQCLAAAGCPADGDGGTRPDYGLMLDPAQHTGAAAAQAVLLQHTYEAYVRWAPASADLLPQELSSHAARLHRWFSAKDFAPRQVLSWASQHYSAVSLRDFWGGAPSADDLAQVGVEGGYTAAAWQQSIAPFLRRAADAVPDMAPLLHAFQTEYRQQYFEQWQRFLANFPRGEMPWWQTREQRRQLALRLMDGDSPYNRVLDATFAQVSPFLPLTMRLDHLPETVSDSVARGATWQFLSDLWRRLAQLWPTAAEHVEQIKTAELSRLSDGPIPDWVRVLHRYLRSDTRKQYLALLQQMRAEVGDLTSAETAFQAALIGFQEAKPSEQARSPVLRAWWLLSQFRGQPAAVDVTTEHTLRPLLERPLLLVWKATLEGAGELMQKAWTDEVTAPTKGLSKLERLNFLYGPQGKTQTFAKQFVDPFLAENRSRPGQVLGEEVPIPAAILTALQEARQLAPILELKTPHRVRVEASRNSVIDSQMGLVEERTELVVECATKTFKVSSRGRDFAESSTTVFWSPEDCGDVLIIVFLACGQTCTERATATGLAAPEASSLRIAKRYAGQTGFLNFIQDFRSGSRAFGAQDFSGSEEIVRRYRISAVRVFYRIEVPDSLAKLISLVHK
jgi:type VI secretion system protein ImpL